MVNYFFPSSYEKVSTFFLSFIFSHSLFLTNYSLIFRAKVHKLKLALSGERKIRKWEKKVLLKLKAFERAHLKQLVARSKHDKSKSIIMGLYTQLFQIVENSSHQLKSALRFKCQPLNSRTIRDYIYKICREPNDFTIIAFDLYVYLFIFYKKL